MLDGQTVLSVELDARLGDSVFRLPTQRDPTQPNLEGGAGYLEHRAAALEITTKSLLQHLGRLESRVHVLEAATFSARWQRLQQRILVWWRSLWR